MKNISIFLVGLVGVCLSTLAWSKDPISVERVRSVLSSNDSAAKEQLLEDLVEAIARERSIHSLPLRREAPLLDDYWDELVAARAIIFSHFKEAQLTGDPWRFQFMSWATSPVWIELSPELGTREIPLSLPILSYADTRSDLRNLLLGGGLAEPNLYARAVDLIETYVAAHDWPAAATIAYGFTRAGHEGLAPGIKITRQLLLNSIYGGQPRFVRLAKALHRIADCSHATSAAIGAMAAIELDVDTGRTVQSLLTILENHPVEPEQRTEILLALSITGDPRAHPYIQDAVKAGALPAIELFRGGRQLGTVDDAIAYIRKKVKDDRGKLTSKELLDRAYEFVLRNELHELPHTYSFSKRYSEELNDEKLSPFVRAVYLTLINGIDRMGADILNNVQALVSRNNPDEAALSLLAVGYLFHWGQVTDLLVEQAALHRFWNRYPHAEKQYEWLVRAAAFSIKRYPANFVEILRLTHHRQPRVRRFTEDVLMKMRSEQIVADLGARHGALLDEIAKMVIRMGALSDLGQREALFTLQMAAYRSPLVEAALRVEVDSGEYPESGLLGLLSTGSANIHELSAIVRMTHESDFLYRYVTRRLRENPVLIRRAQLGLALPGLHPLTRERLVELIALATNQDCRVLVSAN